MPPYMLTHINQSPYFLPKSTSGAGTYSAGGPQRNQFGCYATSGQYMEYGGKMDFYDYPISRGDDMFEDGASIYSMFTQKSVASRMG